MRNGTLGRRGEHASSQPPDDVNVADAAAAPACDPGAPQEGAAGAPRERRRRKEPIVGVSPFGSLIERIAGVAVTGPRQQGGATSSRRQAAAERRFPACVACSTRALPRRAGPVTSSAMATKRRSNAAGTIARLREQGLARYPGAHLKSPWPGHLDLAVRD